MQSNNVTIIIPYIRPEKLKNCIEAIQADGFEGTIYALQDIAHVGCPRMVKHMMENVKTDLVMFLGDDTVPEPGLMGAALEVMELLPDGMGVVGLNTDGESKQHWMAHKSMLPLLDGEFFHTGYKHCFCDDELRDRAQELKRWAYATKAKVKHDHPIKTGETDTSYDSAYSAYWDDRAIYVRRKRLRLEKFAIGFPLVSDTLPVQFFVSYSCMEKPGSYIFLMPQFPHGPWIGSIADARNSLVEQAQMEGCSWLFMLDTDQVYPTDALFKLLRHNVPICGVRVHRRWPPFDPIFYRGELGKYKPVPDAEMFSGDLIEVDATGTGCVLFNMEVFDQVAAPWFQFGQVDGKPVGEDISFMSKAREKGIQIYVDTSIDVGHLSSMVISRGLYELYKAKRR